MLSYITNLISDYGIEHNYNDKTLKYNGNTYTMLNKYAETNDIVFDVHNNRLAICYDMSRNYLSVIASSGANRDTGCYREAVIPLMPTTELFTEFLKGKFLGYDFETVRNIINLHYSHLVSVDMVKPYLCVECGQPLTRTAYYIGDNKYVDEDCFHAKYRTCDKCGQVFRKDDTNECLCEHCRKRDFVLPYHRYNPPIQFYGKTRKNTNPYLGIELEVDGGGESNTMVKKIQKLINNDDMFLYCMHDGSLSEGFEMITQPATLRYHQSIRDKYNNIFNTLLHNGYLSHDTSTCGMHVHFNRDYYKDNEELYVTRLLYLVDKFWDDIVRFSRRNQYRIDRYAKKVDTSLSNYYKQSNKSNRHEYHYYAINLANNNTIEFRMFKGSLNIDTFFATLQFVNNCIVFARNKTSEELQHLTFEELITGRVCKAYWQTRKGRTNTEE